MDPASFALGHGHGKGTPLRSADDIDPPTFIQPTWQAEEECCHGAEHGVGISVLAVWKSELVHKKDEFEKLTSHICWMALEVWFCRTLGSQP